MDYLEGANSEQASAILHSHECDGVALVLAGAGSGKTQVLTKRFLHLFHQGAELSSIVALTFTVKAAEEMKHRIANFIELSDEKSVHIRTIHSLCWYVLKERVYGQYNYARMGYLVQPEILMSDRFVSDSDDPNSLSLILCDELISKVTELLLEFPAIATYYKEHFRHLLIDEFQDTSPDQFQLIKLLAGDSQCLFFVGDDDQAIYGFRGADCQIILNLQNDFRQLKVYKLEKNYRSNSGIVSLANKITENKPEEFKKILVSASNRNDALFLNSLPVNLLIQLSGIQEVLRIQSEILKQMKRYKIGYEQFAILIRYNLQVQYYCAALAWLKIPVGPENNGVTVQTIHGSKGLQYPIVFLCGFSNGLCPGGNLTQEASEFQIQDEEQRLFYVAVTRAECVLYLMHTERRVWRGKKRKFKISSFSKCLNT
jgi:superfamily I DNA/RNA helicase